MLSQQLHDHRWIAPVSHQPAPPGTPAFIQVTRLSIDYAKTLGQAHVYRAHKVTLDNSAVAIKVYKRDLEDADRRRFLREVQALQALRGRQHVVRLLEADLTADGAGYVVMDLYAGSVADRLAVEGTLPVADVLRIGAQVAEALTHAHEAAARILHRDIKPNNILLTDDGTAVLSDFGISAIYRADGRFTATARMGTHGYMAPEVHAGHAESVASDIYSLGATLHTLLLGAPPVLPLALDAVPGPVADALRRALSPDPAQRHGSARALREDLVRIAAHTVAFASAPAPAATKVMPDPAAPSMAPLMAQSTAPLMAQSAGPATAAARPRLVDPPAADPGLPRVVGGGLAALLGGLGLLTLLDWTWWSSVLTVAVPLGTAAVLRRARPGSRLSAPAAAVTAGWYAVPVLVYLSRLGEHPFVNLGMVLLVLVAAGGQVIATRGVEAYVRQERAQAAAVRENQDRALLFGQYAARYWLADPPTPDWLDDVVGPLPAARAMPWRDGTAGYAVICDRGVVLVAVLDGVRPGGYQVSPANGHVCRVFADGRPNTSVDTRLKDLARRVAPVGWGAAGGAAGCVVVLTTDGTRSDGIRLAPARFESTGLTVVVAADAGPAVVRLLAGAEPLVIDPVLLRLVHERASRP